MNQLAPQTPEIFEIWNDELEGILSPLFFTSKPVNKKGFIELKEIATVNPSRKKPTFESDYMVPYVGLPETEDQQIREIWMRPFKQVKERNIIKKGDILFARIEPSVFNKKYIFVEDLQGNDSAFTSTEFYIVEPKENINPLFLFHMFFVEPVYNQVIGKTTGSTGRRRLDKGVFEKILIPFPARAIQDKIVEHLTRAYADKRKKEGEIKKILASIDDFVLGELGIEIPEWGAEQVYEIWSDEVIGGRLDPFFYKPLFRSLLKQIKKQRFVTLGEAISDLSGGATPKISGDYYLENDGIPFLRVQNITEEGIKLDDVKYIKPEVHENQLKRSQLKAGDVIFTITGRIGSVAVVPDNFEGNINQHSVRFHLKDEIKGMRILPEYLAAFFNTQIGRDLSFRYTTGGTRPALDYEALRNLVLPVPNIEKQKKIIDGVENFHAKMRTLRAQATEVLESAQKEVERMILG
jgi:restriction endonuclease S subunit